MASDTRITLTRPELLAIVKWIDRNRADFSSWSKETLLENCKRDCKITRNISLECLRGVFRDNETEWPYKTRSGGHSPGYLPARNPGRILARHLVACVKVINLLGTEFNKDFFKEVGETAVDLVTLEKLAHRYKQIEDKATQQKD